MSSVKISLITVTYNAAGTIERCISSVIAQTYPHLEYIIIDGGSTDATSAILDRYKKHIHALVSEPDKGIYDAMNKGIALATGDIVGILNADDFFAGQDALALIAQPFCSAGVDAVYGDIDFINKQDKVVREWRAGKYRHGYFNWGWMPPHATFYAKRELFVKYGLYDIRYGSAADYELTLRFIHTNQIKIAYINKILVKMLIGGVSNKSLGNRIKAWQHDFRAMKQNGLLLPQLSIILKPFRKIIQYIR